MNENKIHQFLIQYVAEHERMPTRIPGWFTDYKLVDMDREDESIVLTYRKGSRCIDVHVRYMVLSTMQFIWKIRGVYIWKLEDD